MREIAIFSLLLATICISVSSLRAEAKLTKLDIRIAQITRSVTNTDKSLHRFKYVRSSVFEAWFQNGEPRKIKLENRYGNGKMDDGSGLQREEYYCQNNRLIFVREVNADNSSRTGGRWKSYYTTQFYYADGKMFRWALDGKKRTSRDYEELKRTSQYLARARQFLTRSKRALAKQSSSQKKP